MRHPGYQECMHMHSLVACVLPILVHSKVSAVIDISSLKEDS